MVESEDFVKRFLNLGVHVTTSALETFDSSSNEDIEKVLRNLKEKDDRPSVLTEDEVYELLSSEEVVSSQRSRGGNCEVDLEEENALDESARRDDKYSRVLSEGSVIFRDEDEEEGRVEVLENITGKSSSEGEVRDFVEMFKDRFEKLKKILRSREGFQSFTQLENVVRHEDEEVNLVGMVNEVRETRKKDAWIVEIEDTTGKAVIYVKDSERNEEIVESVEKMVTDEVIGVKAHVPQDLDTGNRNPLVFGNEVFYPDIPISKSRDKDNGHNASDPSGYVVLLSDLHVGSSEFLPGAFDKFIKWINGSAGNKKQKKMAENVKYILIAGDLVDGIGVYPGQQKELDIEGISDQYKKVAELLSKVPDDIMIIACPGNHDAVRLAEPQPALYTDVASPLRKINVKLVSNPALLSIEGVKFLMYHGMGFDDLIASDPELDREDVRPPMTKVMVKRHLAPVYGEPMGGRTPFSPEEEDYLTIDEVPDVLHCGHLHKYGVCEYRGVRLVNSATFQDQTRFMKRQGVNPTPGHVPIVDLESKKVRAINFA